MEAHESVSVAAPVADYRTVGLGCASEPAVAEEYETEGVELETETGKVGAEVVVAVRMEHIEDGSRARRKWAKSGQTG